MEYKPLNSLLIFVNLLISSHNAISQEIVPPPRMSEIESKAEQSLDSLLNSGTDIVLGFYTHTVGMVPNFTDTITGYPDRLVFDNYYILYSKNEMWTILRLVSLLPDASEKSSVIQSKPIVFKSDSSLITLKEKLPKVAREGFLPFIMSFESNGIKGYDIGWESHSERYTITVKSKSDSSKHSFEEYVLYEKYRHWDKSPINLNYPYNKSLNLYFVYNKLKSLTSELDKKFVFK